MRHDAIKRVLVAGYGNIGRRHLRIARELLQDADIRVLRHGKSEETPSGANGCFQSLEDAVAFRPDIAVIANPASRHTWIGRPLAEIGTHLLVEKPLSDSLEDAERFLETCEANGRRLQVGYNLRFHPSLRFFRDLVNDGAIGRVYSVRCEVGQYLPSWRPDVDYRRTVSASKVLGGGALLELSHEIDYLRWVFGDIVDVSAVLGRQSELDIDVEDTALLILAFDRRAGNGPLLASLDMDFIRRDTTRLCTAIGETGTLRWDGVRDVVEKLDAGGAAWNIAHRGAGERDDSYRNEWEHFLDGIEKGEKPAVTGRDGLEVLRVVDAARRSSDSRTVVALNRPATAPETAQSTPLR